MSIEQAIHVCASLQSLIDAGLTLSLYIDSTLFDVDQVAVVDGFLCVRGYGKEGIQQICQYPFPVGYISVSVLTPSFSRGI